MPGLCVYITSIFFLVRFYLLEVSNRVANFLGDIQQSANETGINLDVVEWGLEEKLKDWTVLWDYGALLALTDCVYKSMKDHGLAYIVDLDEFIVPQVSGLRRMSNAYLKQFGMFSKQSISEKKTFSLSPTP